MVGGRDVPDQVGGVGEGQASGGRSEGGEEGLLIHEVENGS